ncbi:hypothetical protein FALBO_15028 [Fusarium albosuccineum]|uniref:Uncharacterized protein n=1 Tax=Fusarium albosuccineum TaxID=1237068 RepID=A0A8H4KZ43_9HYPO|nr:hypothetical protein FALBO_15028 [Fusarium albosuccineum]
MDLPKGNKIFLPLDAALCERIQGVLTEKLGPESFTVDVKHSNNVIYVNGITDGLIDALQDAGAMLPPRPRPLPQPRPSPNNPKPKPIFD